MICDEAFMSSALDVPMKDDNVQLRSSTAVEHDREPEHGLWLRVINLELCNRADLSSLMANINFLQKLSPVRLQYGQLESDMAERLDSCLSLPARIELSDTHIVFVYPLSPYGSVFDYMHRSALTQLDETLISVLFSRAVLCLDQLHARGVLHRNLCSQHLLLINKKGNETTASTTADELSIRFCGLGSLTEFPPSSRILRNDLPAIHLAWRGWKLSGDEQAAVPPAPLSQSEHIAWAHPVAWYSPELIGQDFLGYSWQSDIYSLGLILFELCTKRAPYAGLTPAQIMLEKLLLHANAPRLEDGCFSNELLAVFDACTHVNPKKRPTTTQLLRMPWVQQGLSTPFTRSLLE